MVKFAQTMAASGVVTRRTVRAPSFDLNRRPFIVIWEVTRACDLACLHCRASAIPHRDPRELTTDEARSLIDQVAAYGPPAPLFVLTGGDPVKRPDLVELVSYASARKLPVSLSPSATPLLTPELVQDLQQAGLHALSLSLDGASADTHDRFRGIDGVFAKTLTLWESARRCGLKVQINTTVAKINLFELPYIARMLAEREVRTWSVFFLVPVGRGLRVEQISAAECEDVMHFLYDVGSVLRVKTTEGHHYKRIVVQRMIAERRGLKPEQIFELGPTYHKLRALLGPWPSSPLRRPPIEVNAGRGFVFISHVGTVHPSGFLPAVAGSIRKTPLAEIYERSHLFTELRDPTRLNGRCGSCEFAQICGGSRSRAYAATGDYLADDPLCSYIPHSFPFQSDVEQLTIHDC